MIFFIPEIMANLIYNVQLKPSLKMEFPGYLFILAVGIVKKKGFWNCSAFWCFQFFGLLL